MVPNYITASGESLVERLSLSFLTSLSHTASVTWSWDQNVGMGGNTRNPPTHTGREEKVVAPRVTLFAQHFCQVQKWRHSGRRCRLCLSLYLSLFLFPYWIQKVVRDERGSLQSAIDPEVKPERLVVIGIGQCPRWNLDKPIEDLHSFNWKAWFLLLHKQSFISFLLLKEQMSHTRDLTIILFTQRIHASDELRISVWK